MRPSKNKGKGGGGGGGGAIDSISKGISNHVHTLRQRLDHALNLGTRYYEEKELKWKSTDIEIQRHVVRSISAFLDSVSGDTIQHPLVKESVPPIVRALVWILQYQSEAVVGMAANVVVKLISILPSSILQQYMLDFVYPLLFLLSSRELEVAISCSTAVNMILSRLNVKKENQVWEMLKEAKTVACIVTNIKTFSAEMMPMDYFQEMASLLSIILRRWPPSRYPVWSDTGLMKVLEAQQVNPDLSVKVSVFKVYASLVLCGNGAKKLLESGGALLQTMVQCMHSSHALSAQIEAFRLAQCLAMDENGFSKMTSFSCEPLVKAIVCGMSRRSLNSRKVSSDQMSLLVEACRLALVTRWRGQHHNYFWKYGIDKILLDLLIEGSHNQASQNFLSLDECISMAQEGLDTNFLLALRPYVWDILGWISIHCDDDFSPQMYGNCLNIDTLIACACLAFVDSIRKGNQICQHDIVHTSRSISASRAVLLMIYSPCKYIASKSRFVLTEVLNPNVKECRRHMLHALNNTSMGCDLGLPNIIRTVISLVGLTCYFGLPQYREHVIKSEVMKTILAFVKWCLSSRVRIKRQNFAPHLVNKLFEKSCCLVHEREWEGEDVLLLYGLWVLAEVVHHDDSVRDNKGIVSDDVNCEKAQLISMLQEVCCDISAQGPRWFAAYILGHFGIYGFPCNLGKRIGKALHVQEHADMQLILANGASLSVHGVILAIRCPKLLPPEGLHHDEKTADDSSLATDAENLHEKCQKEIRLSAHVDSKALQKLLEFVYMGYLEAGEELVKKLKPLAKSCGLRPLLQMLSRKRPKWGTPYQVCDLAVALRPVGNQFSDFTLEAKESERLLWTCSSCSISVPHKHVHKIVLWSSCDYLRALFQSGMQESLSQRIKVPISWQAMVKLVEWFYTDQLPNPTFGCLWDNMDTEEKLEDLQPYLELCWLAELWLLEDFRDACFGVIVSCLDSDRLLSIKVIQIAGELSLWKLTEVAADYVAPLYNKLRDSGELEELDEFLIDMVRTASVRISQEGKNSPRHMGRV